MIFIVGWRDLKFYYTFYCYSFVFLSVSGVWWGIKFLFDCYMPIYIIEMSTLPGEWQVFDLICFVFLWLSFCLFHSFYMVNFRMSLLWDLMMTLWLIFKLWSMVFHVYWENQITKTFLKEVILNFKKFFCGFVY